MIERLARHPLTVFELAEPTSMRQIVILEAESTYNSSGW